MNKEEIKFNTNEDIIYQIEMMSYDKYNHQIATANEHIGDIYSYRDIEDMKSSETQYEKQLSYIAIIQLQQENKQLKDNWNKLKEWSKHERKVAVGMQNGYGVALCDCMINEMQELEKGDSNERRFNNDN